jgi:hypothetical protein
VFQHKTGEWQHGIYWGEGRRHRIRNRCYTLLRKRPAPVPRFLPWCRRCNYSGLHQRIPKRHLTAICRICSKVIRGLYRACFDVPHRQVGVANRMSKHSPFSHLVFQKIREKSRADLNPMTHDS